MEEITFHKYSLFFIEERYETSYSQIGDSFSKKCFEYIDTFDTLEEAMAEKKEYDLKTIILPSY